MSPPRTPRIAYFPDSFHEVNGVAHTSRNFAAFARRHGIPMLCPAHIINAGTTLEASTGRIVRDEDFAAAITDVLNHPENFSVMRTASRQYAHRCSWDAVFERVLAAYPVNC